MNKLTKPFTMAKPKSITSACNLTQSIASMLEAVDNLQSMIEASGYDKVLKKLEDN